MTICPHCGCAVEKPGSKPRSTDQLRRYFAMIRAAYHQWPEQHDTQFSSEEDCRKTLQMMAGYREIGSRLALTGIKPATALMLAQAAIAGAGSYARPVVHNGELIVWKPISISCAKMGHQEFCKLNDGVAAVIEAAGLKVDDLMREAA